MPEELCDESSSGLAVKTRRPRASIREDQRWIGQKAKREPYVRTRT